MLAWVFGDFFWGGGGGVGYYMPYTDVVLFTRQMHNLRWGVSATIQNTELIYLQGPLRILVNWFRQHGF